LTNYEFWLDGQPWDREDIPIGCVFREEWQRPEVGQEVRIKGKIFKVVRTVPAGNPTGQKVIYYVENLNPDWPYKKRE
jgi:hypothetical protein